MDPARMCTESLTPRPELENGQDPEPTSAAAGEAHVRCHHLVGSARGERRQPDFRRSQACPKDRGAFYGMLCS